MNRYDELLQAVKELHKAQAKSKREEEKSFNAPTGTSRARRTTLNARWATAAEHRDRMAARVRDAIGELPELDA